MYTASTGRAHDVDLPALVRVCNGVERPKRRPNAALHACASSAVAHARERKEHEDTYAVRDVDGVERDKRADANRVLAHEEDRVPAECRVWARVRVARGVVNLEERALGVIHADQPSRLRGGLVQVAGCAIRQA
jgi:hypothetical protein